MSTWVSGSGQLVLIPSLLGSDDVSWVAPVTAQYLKKIKHFIVESEKSARRFLKKVDRDIVIDELTFYVIPKNKGKKNKFVGYDVLNEFLMPASMGGIVGLLSDAGCPAIADPGNVFVAEAHKQGVQVVPLPGPSSILLALIASGLNGQSFSFYGYLPIDSGERRIAIRKIEDAAINTKSAQIFMETPFRNMQILETILAVCSPKTKLCIAMDISMPSQKILTLSLSDWRKLKPNLHKIPAVFVMGV